MINDFFHVTYCTNVHPGADWKTTFQSLEMHLNSIRLAVAQDKSFGLGLRLSNQASIELGEDNNLIEFKNWLSRNNIYVFTMNGFPYGNFHGKPVKDQVHYPDWTTEERFEYTSRLFKQLAYLLPKGMDGGISTSPVSYKFWFNTEEDKVQALKQGAISMANIAIQLIELETETGQYLHLDIEPEPDGLLENSADVVHFFEHYLLHEGVELISGKLGIAREQARALMLRHITVCYDVCHFALAFENPAETFEKFRIAGIQIGKIQVSAALRIPSFSVNDTLILQTLKDFDEPVYLHQVTTKTAEGLKTWSDLSELFKETEAYEELRAHFHVPIFQKEYGVLGSTQQAIEDVVEFLKDNPICSHLEVETYTWEVLPGKKDPLSNSIIREMNWLIEKFV